MAARRPASLKNTGAATTSGQRKIQAQVDAADTQRKPKAKSSAAADRAVQTGRRKQPQNPLPAQHQRKPGIEAELRPRPKFMAPDYRGSDKLRDMAALITGGDSGIGRSVAVLYAREGADVAIVYLSEHQDAEKTRRCVEAEGRRCVLIPDDVKNTAFCRAAVQQTVDAFGKLDILVNNAAFQEHAELLEEISDVHFDETLRTNLYGYFYMARAALPHLQNGASIINTGSETGLFGSKQLLDYSTTKGGIHAFTKALASNVVARGIRVNAVAPGPVWTPLNPADRPAQEIKKFGKLTAMKCPAQPEEISPAYVFLASPVTASYITGIVLPIMGGTPGA